MKPIVITFCFALFFSFSTKAQMPDSATMMKNWMDYMTPSKEHQMMASWNGAWTGDISVWMAPGAPATKSTGSMTNSMLMGGRYQMGKFTGSFGGMPFEGMSTLAFDKVKKVFISTWIDNMGTGVMTLQGPWNEESKSITLTGKMVDPGTGKEINVKEIYKTKDKNNHSMEMFAQGADGNEFKTMEIIYKRKM